MNPSIMVFTLIDWLWVYQPNRPSMLEMGTDIDFQSVQSPNLCFYRLFPLVEFRIDLANEGIMRIWPISQKLRKWSTHEPTYPWKSGALRNQSIVITNYSLWRMLVNSCITRILVNKQTNDMFLLQSASFLDSIFNELTITY